MYGRGLIIVILIVVLAVYYTHNGMHLGHDITPSLHISVEEARSRRFGLIIDVRTTEERSQLGYYPQSIPIDIHDIQKGISLDISNKNTPILIYSNADGRAKVAADIIYYMGYRNVRYITTTYLSLLPGSS
jgi:rhodanese-related sulfurtransferase